MPIRTAFLRVDRGGAGARRPGVPRTIAAAHGPGRRDQRRGKFDIYFIERPGAHYRRRENVRCTWVQILQPSHPCKRK